MRDPNAFCLGEIPRINGFVFVLSEAEKPGLKKHQVEVAKHASPTLPRPFRFLFRPLGW